MDTSIEQFLDMTISCLSMQMQNLSIHCMYYKAFYGFSNTFSILLVGFFEHDMIGNFSGTISNMKSMN